MSGVWGVWGNTLPDEFFCRVRDLHNESRLGGRGGGGLFLDIKSFSLGWGGD